MKRIIAIFGSSCSGKTTVANGLGDRLGMHVRNCGEVVRERASAIGTTPSDLSDDIHEAIDAETRELAAQDDSRLVIDGSFLDHVLSGLTNVIFVELRASAGERERRHAARGASGRISERDAIDQQLRSRLYNETPRDPPHHVVDTTALSAEDVVERISALVA